MIRFSSLRASGMIAWPLLSRGMSSTPLMFGSQQLVRSAES
jgi:hypothetical protein